jgi:hypothetical protein
VINPESGPYSRLNARRSSPVEVARDFVPPPTYQALLRERDPQILRGPRGIGKTTLLKMLLPEAIDAWSHTKAQEVRATIGFTGAFVAADRMWAGQLTGMQEGVPSQHRSSFGRAAFAFMALAALAETAEYRVSKAECRAVELDRNAEEDLAAAVAPVWLAHPATASLGGLADQMHAKVAELSQLMHRLASPATREEDVEELMRNELLNVDFWSAATFFIRAFNRAADEQHAPWILLIDEFEFLPRWTRVALGESFQGKDPLLSFKLSIAPYTSVKPFAGSVFNDWTELELAPKRAQRETEQNDFAARLLKRQIAERVPEGAAVPEPEIVFPRDAGGEGRHGASTGDDSYGPETPNAALIDALASIDPGFRAFIGRLLGPAGLAGLDKSGREYHELRKAMPLVRLRLEYWKAGTADGPPTGRSRHATPRYYAGAQNIYTISENNPRWLKALAHDLLAKYKPGQQVSQADQTVAIRGVANELYNNLRAVAIEEYDATLAEESTADADRARSNYQNVRPFGLIATLGDYMRDWTHGEEFRPNVPGTFAVDVEDPWLDDVVNSLVFLGALVLEGRDPDGRALVRPAHMWAPIFRLLLRKGPPRSLRKVLAQESSGSGRDPDSGGESRPTGADAR